MVLMTRAAGQPVGPILGGARGTAGPRVVGKENMETHSLGEQ